MKNEEAFGEVISRLRSHVYVLAQTPPLFLCHRFRPGDVHRGVFGMPGMDAHGEGGSSWSFPAATREKDGGNSAGAGNGLPGDI